MCFSGVSSVCCLGVSLFYLVGGMLRVVGVIGLFRCCGGLGVVDVGCLGGGVVMLVVGLGVEVVFGVCVKVENFVVLSSRVIERWRRVGCVVVVLVMCIWLFFCIL